MKHFFYFLSIITTMIYVSCSVEKPADVVPEGMKALILKDLGYPLSINISDDESGPLLDTTSGPMGLEIKMGGRFDIVLNFAGAEDSDLEKQKVLIMAEDAGDTKFLTSTPEVIIYETKFGELSKFHFIRVINVDGVSYTVRDNNNNPDNQFKKEDIDKMDESAKSLRAIVTAEAKKE